MGGGGGSAAERVISGAQNAPKIFNHALILRPFDHDCEILNLRSSSSSYTYVVTMYRVTLYSYWTVHLGFRTRDLVCMQLQRK